MYGVFNFLDRVKRYYAFSPEEIKSLVIAILILSFIVGFDDGREKFEFSLWLFNFFNCFLIVALSILVRESFHRLFAIKTGHVVEVRLWGIGLGLALFLAIISSGKIPLLVYGGFVISFIPRQRLGYFRYGLSFNNMATVALWGNFSNILLALFFKFFSFIPNPLIQKAMLINIFIACLNMLPIPPLSGSTILFVSRPYYVFATILIFAAAGLMIVASIPVTLIGSFFLALLTTVLLMFFGKI